MEQRGYILTDDKQSDCHSHLTSLIGRNLEKIEFPVFGNIVDFCFNFDSELSIRIFGQIGPETWVYNAVDGQVYTGPYWNF